MLKWLVEKVFKRWGLKWYTEYLYDEKSRELFNIQEKIDGIKELVIELKDIYLSPQRVEIKLDSGAAIPTQPYVTDACWDLYAMEDVWIRPGDPTYVTTGVYVNIPEGFEGELKCRSSHGKMGLMLHHGAFDAGYQGEVAPFMFNWTNTRYEVHKGERVAQFCLRRKFSISWNVVTEFTPSVRGDKGHGSSGK